MTQLITSVATVIGVVVMMLRISVLMTVVALIIMPISVVMVSLIVKKSQKYFKQQQEYLGHINGQVEEVFGGHNVIKAFNKEEDTLRVFRDTNEILYHSAWKITIFIWNDAANYVICRKSQLCGRFLF